MTTPARFETDVFLSFADPDDASVMGEPGWVTGFRTALGAFAQQILGRPLTLVDATDAGIGPMGSATFVAIVSPGYLQAPERLTELGTFADTAAMAVGPTGGGERRIFKVVKAPVRPDEIPEPLRPCLEYAFFDLDEGTGMASEFRVEFGPEAKQRFLSKTYELAQDLCARVMQVQETGATPDDTPPATAEGHEVAAERTVAAPETFATRETPAPAEIPAAPPTSAVSANGGGRSTVYLAQTTSDQSEARDLVRGELIQRGHTVLPDRDLPYAMDELDAVVRDALERCDLAVHIVGSTYGLVPEGASRSIVDLQCELAGERGLPRLIWLSPDLEPSDDRQTAFVEALEDQAVARRTTDLLRTPLETFKTAIRDTLAEIQKAGRLPTTSSDQIYIYLICDERDYRATKPIEDSLRAMGFDVWVPPFEGEASEIREVHKQHLIDCDANIVFYGEASDTWFQTKMIDWRKVPGWGRAGPMLAQAVYVGPPLEGRDPKRRLRVPEAVLIENFDAFSQESLEPFLFEIRRNKSGS